MIRGVIWDVDGTIADTIPMIVGILQRTIVEFGGREYSREEIEGMFGPTEEGVLKLVLDADGDAGYERFLEEYASRHDAEVTVFDGVQAIVGDLERRGIRQAVVTGKGPLSARITLEKLELDRTFEVVSAGSVEGQFKDTAIAAIVDGWHMDRQEVLYVGDHPSDVRDAHRAGVRSAVAAWKRDAETSWVDDLKPDATFDSTAALAEWLDLVTG